MGSRAFYACEQNGKRLPFEMLGQAAIRAGTEFLLSFKEDLAAMPQTNAELDITQPANVTVQLSNGETLDYEGETDFFTNRKIGRRTKQLWLVHHKDQGDQIEELLAEMPRLLLQLKTRWAKKKPDWVMFTFEWHAKLQSAKVSQLNKILEGVKAERAAKKAQEAGLVLPPSGIQVTNQMPK